MAEFTPINTQEELDALIGERIKREKEKHIAEIAEMNEKLANEEKEKNELTGKLETAIGELNESKASVDKLNENIKGYETDSVKKRIALEVGLPYQLADKLSGEDEESIRADAESILKVVGAPTLPLNDPEANKKDGEKEEYKQLLKNLKGDE